VKKVFRIEFAAIALMMFLSACSADSTKPDISGSNAAAITTPVVITAAQIGIPYEDQLSYEQTIRNFASAIEKKDFKLAEQYCTQDFKNYIENTLKTGSFADPFSLAITKGYDLKLAEVKGFYYTGTSQPDYTISKDKPTLNFIVLFDYVDSNGEKGKAGGYTMGVKSADGRFLLSGFASGL
jgi:hypothetical protein